MLSWIKSVVVLFTFLCLVNFLWSQPHLDKAIEQMVESLIPQINANENIQTVLITDFTDISYQPNLLADLLTKEFMTSFLNTPNKNFILVNRDQFKVLLKEEEFGRKGYLHPDNRSKLGLLKGIDLIIGATLSPSTNYLKVIVEGVEIETGSLVAATKGSIMLTPSLRELLNQSKKISDDPETQNSKVGSSISGKGISFSRENIEVTAKGCQYSNSQLQCHFSIVSIGMESELSMYTSASSIYLTSDYSSGYALREIRLGNKTGNRRITQILQADQPYDLIVFAALGKTHSQKITRLNLKCYTPRLKTFNMVFDQIPITQ